MTAFVHETVMRDEAVTMLGVREGGRYIDATLGGGGHSEAILRACAPGGRVVAADRDLRAIEASQARLRGYQDRVTFVHAAFSELRQALEDQRVGPVDGLIADLGVSSPQLDVAERGFSFARSGPLDMRMDTSRGETAAELLRRLSERELADLIFELGDERRSRPVARAIRRAIDADELHTTSDLRRVVSQGYHGSRRIDPATRTFLALRIAVNRELEELSALLEAAPMMLVDGGVCVVIAFHSAEDRLVKRAFREDPRWLPLVRRPLRPSDEECARNPRARSAKLRAARRVALEGLA